MCVCSTNYLNLKKTKNNNIKTWNEDDGFFDLASLFLGQILPKSWLWWVFFDVLELVFIDLNSKQPKQQNKNSFFYFSAHRLLHFPYSPLQPTNSLERVNTTQETKASCLPPWQRRQKLLSLLDGDSRVVGILQRATWGCSIWELVMSVAAMVSRASSSDSTRATMRSWGGEGREWEEENRKHGEGEMIVCVATMETNGKEKQDSTHNSGGKQCSLFLTFTKKNPDQVKRLAFYTMTFWRAVQP